MGACNAKPTEATEETEISRDVSLGAPGEVGAKPFDETTEVWTNAPDGVDSSVPRCKKGCGRRVQPGEYRPGRAYDTCCKSCALNDGLSHDLSCGGAAVVARRPVCAKGSRCRDRNGAHLETQAHPLDIDYPACFPCGDLKPEKLSLKVLFNWADADGSGKLSREELQDTFAQLKNFCTDALPDLTDDAWAKLDEDGNGVLNFMEFASWAGPRMGLPLGVERMIHRTETMGATACPCNALGCPCEEFEPAGDGKLCKVCRHKRDVHLAKAQGGEVPYPDYWDNASSVENFQEMKVLPQGAYEEFQQLLTRTHIGKWTRDRTKHNPANPKVPTSYQVVKVIRSENSHCWKEYGVGRAELIHRTQEQLAEGRPLVLHDVKTMEAYRAMRGTRADRLAKEVNEWYLFHGTHPDRAKTIMENDFRVGCAGSNTGTLYGKGLYFAESITKADEYAKQNANGDYAVILCRVLGGRVNYCDEVEPNPEALVQSCIAGDFDCVLGDREKCKGTYREFVLFDSEDVYPEYLIEYKRVY